MTRYAVTVRASSYRWPREQEMSLTIDAETPTEAQDRAHAHAVALYWNPNTMADVRVTSVKAVA